MRAAVVVAVVAPPRPLPCAAPSDEFAKGRQFFTAKDYGSAQPIFNDLVHPKPQLASREDLVECYIMLGTSRVEDTAIAKAPRPSSPRRFSCSPTRSSS